MTLQKMKDQLPNSDSPIEKILQENECSITSLIGFSNGMMLKENRVKLPTKLMVLCGTVKYIQLDKKVILNKFDEFEIPADITHYIIAEDDSLCLLTQDRMYQDN